MTDLLRTTKTYATRENAVKALEKACVKLGADPSKIKYLIAVNDEGRFAPVVVGVNLIQFAILGEVTVVG